MTSCISVLAGLNELEEVYMSFSNVKTLVPIMYLPNLKIISIRGLSIPAEEINQFKALHPNCVVYDWVD